MLALDAKMNFDDNALYRHTDLEDLRDLDEEDPAEIEAKRYDLSYIKLDGTIGCMVNGAGLAMATMDMIKHFGGAAGELPRRGRRRHRGAGHRGVQDHHLRSHGARHLRQHLRRHHEVRHHRRRGHRGGQGGRLKVPLVVRLEGTNVELGKKMLAESGLAVTTASDMADGAQKVVALAKGAR